MSAEPVVDFLIGDELKTFDTIKNWATGHPVSSDDAIHAGLTIGSDLLWIVPGLGPAVRGAKYAGKAATAAKAASAGSKAVRAGRAATKAAVAAGLKSNVGSRAKAKASKVVSDVYAAKYSKALKRVKKKKGMVVHQKPYDPETVEKYAQDAKRYSAKAAEQKAKRNSKNRNNLRKVGHGASFAGNFSTYTDE